MTSVGIIVQARSSSTRLPNKIYKKIYKNYSVLEFLLYRFQNPKNIHKLIIGTTKKDLKKIRKIAAKYNFIVETGSENNVLSRFYKIAKKYKLDVIIRVNADSPLLSKKIIEKYIRIFLKNKNIDYLTNILKPTFPHGSAIEIFKFNVLQKAFRNAKNKDEIEHVTPYIYKNKNKFSILNIKLKKNYSKYRLSIDYPEDLNLLRKIIPKSKLGINLTFMDAIKIIKKYPKIKKINDKFINTFSIN